MKAVILIAAIGGIFASLPALADPIDIRCRQDFTQASYTITGHAIPVRRFSSNIRYILDEQARTITIVGPSKRTVFHDGGGQHILVESGGLTMAGTTRFPNDGPVTSQILRFNADGTRGAGESKLVMRGHLLQQNDTVLHCVRAD
ncbi:hypothetical protein HZF05_20595 [Sphingomonas sp. CGMCC 1.13654]|uniref:Uncharacterized protein n=1 Tax=Sphingomonas chungangi TaxID=2683589 RepID=A0A838LGD3_9SPHN|nr:hypothetical protein [Sphingomonas chungangi]MBA2936488.1 hypothetical protein [Sphingomonas chungangi]MVW55873.1 hypothetical protein [Sphingomonas chungangi]